MIVGGLWRPVRLRSSGAVAIRHARAVCAEVHTSGDGDRGPNGRQRRVLGPAGAAGRPRRAGRGARCTCGPGSRAPSTSTATTPPPARTGSKWTVDVADPPLWWPHSLGDQRLCDLEMEALWGGEVHDRRRFRIGFRSVEMRRWVLHVNGERLFAKGANLLPTKPLLGTASPSEVADDIRAARNAGLDMVRPHRPHRPRGLLRHRRRAGDAHLAGPARQGSDEPQRGG